MPGFSRASMPQNFYDITSAQLLTQPEPQYLYAMLYLNALSASLEVPSMISQVNREMNVTGAPYTAEQADRLVLSDPLSTDLFAAKVDFKGMPHLQGRTGVLVFWDLRLAASPAICAGRKWKRGWKRGMLCRLMRAGGKLSRRYCACQFP